MLLYLVRHGIAESESASGADADRALTDKGTLRAAMVAKGIRRLGIRFDRIVSSPYVRARQTAEIFARVTAHHDDILFDQRLVPFARFEETADLIKENDDVESLLLTGHMPSMGETISGLVADGRLQIDVRKASVSCIDLRRLGPIPAGILMWSLPPRMFESLSR